MLGHPPPPVNYIPFSELMTDHVKYLETNAQSQASIVAELKKGQKTMTELQSLRHLNRLKKLARERGMLCALMWFVLLSCVGVRLVGVCFCVLQRMSTSFCLCFCSRYTRGTREYANTTHSAAYRRRRKPLGGCAAGAEQAGSADLERQA